MERTISKLSKIEQALAKSDAKANDLASAVAKALGRRGGLKGGKATGASKRRGDSAHYRAIGAKGGRPMRAVLMVDAVQVACPGCAEPQPCHTGSEMWTPEDFELVDGPRPCVSCGISLRIVPGDAKFR